MTEVSEEETSPPTDEPIECPTVLHARVVTETGGGPEKTILNSPRFLRHLGYRGLCAYMHPPDDPGFNEITRRADACDAPLFSVPDRGPFDLGVVRKLTDTCRAENVAIWHAHDYKSNLLGLLIRRRWPMQLITTVHGWGVRGGRRELYNWIDKKCLKGFDRVLCVSDDLYTICIQSGVPSDRCEVIENGIDVETFTRTLTQSAAKQQLGIQPDRLLVGAVGRLSKEKGFDLLIEAVGALIDGGTDVELAIVGEGDERPQLEALIKQQSEPARFRLLGYRDDVSTFYQALDVYALSSLREGLPNVLLEAMALETPVVATRIAGVPRLVRHGQNGLLVESNDASALSHAIAELLNAPEQRAAVASAGRRTVEDEFSFAARMERIRDIYDGLLNRPGR